MENTRTRLENTGERNWERGDVLKGIVRRRAEKRAKQVMRGVQRRSRAFGRGALIGYSIQENPGRAVVLSFILGAFVGAVGHALRRSTDEFHELLGESEMEDTMETHPESQAA